MAAGFEGDYSALQISIVADNGYIEFKIERKDLGDFTKLPFSVTFDQEKKELQVRTKKDDVLYGCNHIIKGKIDTSNLEGGLKKEKKHAFLRINKKEKFKLSDE